MKLLHTEVKNTVPGFNDENKIETEYLAARQINPKPLLILDDDPTGIQTVHGISLYTQWDIKIMQGIFRKRETAFILTNTRAFHPEKATAIISEIMLNALKVSQETGIDFEIISRSDSTLRGHWPLETSLIRDMYEKFKGKRIDGEIMIPFFCEGGRFTINNIHYVAEGDYLIPASETEFAKDPNFSFQNADLKKYIEEKTNGQISEEKVHVISLDMLRKGDSDEIENLLMNVKYFEKVILNALEYKDIKTFIPPLFRAISKGKKFLYRTAASFVKTMAFVDDKPLLSVNDFKNFKPKGNQLLIIAGSYTAKTTSQLTPLIENQLVEAIEIDIFHLLDKKDYMHYVDEVLPRLNRALTSKKNVLLYTSRTLVKTKDHLYASKIISDFIITLVKNITNPPDMIIAKGGITSHVIAVEALEITHATVKGQVLPGVPSIIAGKRSKWPGMPYVIFPGNVGDDQSLLKIVEKFGL